MPVEPPCLFVYGTLQPGHLRWPFLEPFAIGHGPADVYGQLFDSGDGWPVAGSARASPTACRARSSISIPNGLMRRWR